MFNKKVTMTVKRLKGNNDNMIKQQKFEENKISNLKTNVLTVSAY
ncbi:hypothetical protein SAMN02787073_4925 [Chryseobacterium vrystaatense]|uniref:Uncharacterized protein n=1 Tax=Chryseobacterium vrystaatense TaxID=307480 RepID=A0A1M5N2H9_9FLAO|nr:hypothetical protein SAMN02787073_4925 [Chryseobacterium vrystaatense]